MKRIGLIILVLMMTATCILAACEGSDSESSLAESVAESNGNASSEVLNENSADESTADSSDVVEDSSLPAEESKEESKADESKSEESKNQESENEESKNQESDGGETSENIGNEPVVPVELLFSRYTQQPHFVMIGTCAMGADVTAEYNGQKVTVESYMGWFEVTLKNTSNATFLDITFTQTVDGKAYGEAAVITAKPSVPEYKGTSAIGSNGAFQFFIEKMVPDYEGGSLYPTSAINSMTNRVKERVSQLRQYNKKAEIIYMIVPSPMTIYPELVPDYYTKGTGTTRYEQVKAGLESAGATVIDLRETFTEHKNDEMPLYYKLDSHWADYGAYLAYVELFEHISKSYPDAAPRDIDDFTWTADYYTSADACLYLDIPQVKVKEYGYFREFDFEDPANITSVPRYRGMQLIYNDLTTEEKYFDTNRSNLPSCIVYRDSYCAGIYDLIPERMDVTHYMGMWGYAWNNWMINNESPDYVIYIVSEWNSFEVVYN